MANAICCYGVQKKKEIDRFSITFVLTSLKKWQDRYAYHQNPID